MNIFAFLRELFRWTTPKEKDAIARDRRRILLAGRAGIQRFHRFSLEEKRSPYIRRVQEEEA